MTNAGSHDSSSAGKPKPNDRDLERERTRLERRARLKPHWPAIRPQFSEREARVLELRLGLSVDVGCTQETIARRLHVSTQAIGTIERRALARAFALLDALERS